MDQLIWRRQVHNLWNKLCHLSKILFLFIGKSTKEVPGHINIVRTAVSQCLDLPYRAAPLVHDAQLVVLQTFDARLQLNESDFRQRTYILLRQIGFDFRKEMKFESPRFDFGRQFFHLRMAQNTVRKYAEFYLRIFTDKSFHLIYKPLCRLFAIVPRRTVQSAKCAGLSLSPPTAPGPFYHKMHVFKFWKKLLEYSEKIVKIGNRERRRVPGDTVYLRFGMRRTAGHYAIRQFVRRNLPV